MISHLSNIATSKTKEEKEKAIRACLENENAKNGLIILLDPMRTYHIQAASFKKQIDASNARSYDDIVSMCDDLNSLKAASHNDIARVIATLNAVKETRKDLVEPLKELICKTMKIGVTAATVNKIAGEELIPVFSCMLANKYFDHQDVLDGERIFAVTEKFDGIRCLAFVQKNKARLYSRQGQQIEGLVEIEEELIAVRDRVGKDFVLDGELLISNRDGLPSKEQYKRTIKIVRSDGEKRNITYHAFDTIGTDGFEEKCCDIPYYLRRQKLETYLITKPKHVEVVPILYSGSDVNEMLKCLEEQRNLKHEGVMINLVDVTYQFKRTNALLKVKVMQDCDVEIIGYQEGTGKYAGTLGAIIVDYKGTKVGVGSGISDALRKEIWDKRFEYYGRIATVQYFEETNDADGNPSIRFPVLKDIREDGKEVSYI